MREDQKLIIDLRKYLSPIEVNEVPEGGEIYFEKNEINLLLSHLKSEFQFLLLLDITAEDLSGKRNVEARQSHRYEVIYHLLNLEDHFRLRIRMPTDGVEAIASAVDNFSNASWYEQEIWDMYGILFEKQDNLRILNHQSFKGFPLRKDFVEEPEDELQEPYDYFNEQEPVQNSDRGLRSIVNLGPVHPITRGAIRSIYELDGEVIVRNKIEIGYYHRCIEKIFEKKTWSAGLLIAEQLSDQSPFLSSLAYAHAVETLYDIEIPDRAKALRMAFSELSRIVDHLNCIGELSLSSGNETIMFKCLDLRERIFELFEKASGSRTKASLNVLGGLSKDIPIGWIADCLTHVNYIEENILIIDKLLTRSQVWMTRTNVCQVTSQMALEYGFSGPNLRATGINYDLRKVTPFYFYDDIDFEVPMGINGLCYDRYLVRIEEIRQSLKIIIQVLDNLPFGDTVALHPLSEIYHTKTNINESIADNFIKNKSIPPVKRMYTAIESANGELGFYIISDGTKKPWRIKVRSPSFPHLQGLGKISPGLILDDAITSLSSLNITPGELDR
jgi:NADH-quinone oxidoreductase subunit C/D